MSIRLSKSVQAQIYRDRSQKRRRISEFLEQAVKEFDLKEQEHRERSKQYAQVHKDRLKKVKAEWYKRRKRSFSDKTNRTGRESCKEKDKTPPILS